jgi:hypothetical protein
MLARKQRGPRSCGGDAVVKDKLVRCEIVDATGLSGEGDVPFVRLDSNQMDVESRPSRSNARVV